MEKIHFIGIGGIGMSGLAAISLAEGKEVSGSDLYGNDLTGQLSGRGAVIYLGHSAGNVASDVSLVVRSACIKDDNPEVSKARELGVPVISRGEYLKTVMERFPVSVAVTGTHGKTTTSALIAHIMESCGEDPTVVVGGEIGNLGSNAKLGKSDLIIAEVDESDGTFRDIRPTYALITNVEREHMDHYGSMENLLKAYEEFIGGVSSEGALLFNGEDLVLKQMTKEAKSSLVNFGIKNDFTVTCVNLDYKKAIEFELVISGMNLGKVKSSLVGRHNVFNILGAIALCMQTGLDFEAVSEAVASFSGVKRRFDIRGKIGSIEVIEDYAHHPTELAAVIRAARDYGKGRIITVFQPHRYSRTHDLAHDFLHCFYDSDVLILTEVYSAFEDGAEKTDIREIFGKIAKERFECLDFVEKDRIPEYISGLVRENDIILVLGAGDIREVSDPIVEKIREKTEDRR
ncbi:MAG: UDP-N-acetylmuramate--L-alanine ligase [Candidatus Omnitrophota bacterium]